MNKKIISAVTFCIMCGFTIYVAIIAVNCNDYLTYFNLKPIMMLVLPISILNVLLFFNYYVYDAYYGHECYDCGGIFLFLSLVLNCFNLLFFCQECKNLSLLAIKFTNNHNKYHIAIYVLFIMHFILSLVLHCILIEVCYRPRKHNNHNTKNTQITNVIRHNINNINANAIANYEFEQITEEPNDTNIISNIENKNIKECCICITQYKQKYVLIPCGHTQVCFNCYNKLQQKKCPLCNKQIKNIIKMYE